MHGFVHENHFSSKSGRSPLINGSHIPHISNSFAASSTQGQTCKLAQSPTNPNQALFALIKRGMEKWVLVET
jgi:hypothetical protein